METALFFLSAFAGALIKTLHGRIVARRRLERRRLGKQEPTGQTSLLIRKE